MVTNKHNKAMKTTTEKVIYWVRVAVTTALVFGMVLMCGGEKETPAEADATYFALDFLQRLIWAGTFGLGIYTLWRTPKGENNEAESDEC